jgi:hypothetical protein
MSFELNGNDTKSISKFNKIKHQIAAIIVE